MNYYRPVHVQGDQNKAEKLSYGVGLLQNSLWNYPANSDDTMSENIQWSHKLHHENLRKLELAARRQTFAEGEIQRGILQGDSLLPLLFTIAMMPLNYEMQSGIQTYKITRKD